MESRIEIECPPSASVHDRLEANIKRNVSTMTGTTHDNANLLVDNMQINLENDDNPDSFLRKICDCLQNKIKDNVINRICADMETALGEC